MNTIKRFLLNLPFASKVVLLFSILAVSLALLIIAIIVALYHQRDSQAWAIHTEEVLLSMEQLQRYCVDIVSSSRGYQLKPRSFFIDLINDRKIKIPAERTRLKSLLQDNADQYRRFLEIRDYVDNLNELVSTEMLISKSEKLPEYNDLQSSTLNTLRNKIDQFILIETELSTKRIRNLINSFKRTLLVIGIGALAWFSLAFFVAVIFSKNTSARLAALGNQMVKFADNPRANALELVAEDRDEIGKLAKGVRSLLLALAERARESETFVYSVSHDMRSPLVNLQGFSAELNLGLESLKNAISNRVKDPIVQSELTRIIDHECIDSSNFVSNSTRRLAQIIDSLLLLSRIGRIEPKIEQIDTRKLINEIAQSLRGAGLGKTSQFVIGDLPLIRSDSQAIQQIFQNLLTNSVKYLSPSRPGEIQVSTDDKDEDSNKYYVFKIRDNGRGIPKEFFGKLFMPFQRYHTDVVDGEGMGLALVSRLIRRLGGEISVHSEVEQFSEFTVKIPKDASLASDLDHIPSHH